MKKNLKTLLLTFISASTLCFSQKAFSQVPTFVSPVVCMPAQDTNAVGVPTTYTLNTNGATVTSIPALGDLQIVSISPGLPSAAATITIVAKSKNVGRDTVDNCVNYLNSKTKKFGFGRGVLRVYYTSGGCGSYFDLTINKLFNETPPIVGPKCVAVGDTVTYSVCSILSVNQNANIGIDKYVWGTDNTPIPGLKRVYKSGDSSSVTYEVLAGWNGGTLSCKFGVCNSLTSTLFVGVKTKAPSSIFINANLTGNGLTTCVRTGKSPIFVRAIAPVAGYTYQWSTNNSNWGFGVGGTPTATTASGDSVSLDIKQGGGTVYLTTIGGCGTRTDTLIIGRTLDSTNLSIKRTDTVSCIIPGSNITFSVNNATNTANLGNLSFIWSVPTGWAITGTATGSTITAVAGTVGGVVRAKSTGCTSDSLRLAVSVKLAKPGAIVASTTPGCLPAGTTAPQTYTVPVVPGATGYQWSNTAGWAGTSATNSITLTPSGATGTTISVRAVGGAYSCPGDTARRIIYFAPATADSITVTGCWNVGIVDSAGNQFGTKTSTPVFAVLTPQAGVTYTWSVIPATGGTLSASTGNSVTFTANGKPGSYEISVVSSNANCTGGGTKKRTVVVAKNGTISHPAGYPSAFNDVLQITGASAGSTYRWFKAGNINLAAPYTNSNYSFVFSGAGQIYFCDVTNTAGCVTTHTDTSINFAAARPAPVRNNTSTASLNDATISPNPAKNDFTIVLPVTTSKTRISIFNSKGALVKQQTYSGSSNKISTANWANGEYVIKLTNSKGETVTRKLVVNK